MRIKLGSELKADVWEFLKHNKVGKRPKGGNGSKTQAYTGLLGEVAVKRLFGKDDTLSEGFDGGFDFEHKGMKIDVKTTGRIVTPRPYYAHNFMGYQKDFDCDAYIFCTLCKKTSELYIDGWVTKEELFERSEKFKKGSIRKRDDGTELKLKATGYEILIENLNPLEKLLK